MTGAPRRGRRPGAPDTRAAILAAARTAFAAHGYGGTSVRAVAAAAGVDAALVHHYFGSKDDLFLAALEVRVDPRQALRVVAEGGVAGAGERLLRVFFSVWEDDQARLPLLGLLRASVDGSGRELARDGFLRVVVAPVGVGLGVDHAEERMSLVVSQLLGLALLRYVVAAEPMASADPERLVTLYAPVIQRYLEEPLP